MYYLLPILLVLEIEDINLTNEFLAGNGVKHIYNLIEAYEDDSIVNNMLSALSNLPGFSNSKSTENKIEVVYKLLVDHNDKVEIENNSQSNNDYSLELSSADYNSFRGLANSWIYEFKRKMSN